MKPATFEAGSREAFEAEMARRANAVADDILGSRKGGAVETFRKKLAEWLVGGMQLSVHGNWAFYEERAAAVMFWELRAVMKDSPALLRDNAEIREKFDAACTRCQQASGGEVIPFDQWVEQKRKQEAEARREKAAREANTINLEEL